MSTALPAFLQSLRFVSAYAVTQLPFICPWYRLPLRRRLWSPLLLSCFFLVWSACRKFTVTFTSGFECPSFPYFLLFFSGLHFVTCGSPFYSLHSTLFIFTLVLRMISFVVRFPVLGTFFYVLRSFTCFNLCLFWPAVPLRPLLTRVAYTFSGRFLFLSASGEFRSVSTFSSRVSPFVRELVFDGLASDVSNSSVWMVLVFASCGMV